MHRAAVDCRIWKFPALIALLSLVFAHPAFAEKRIALVVGNSAYQNVTRLENPRSDAILMADTLGSLGFTLIGGRAQRMCRALDRIETVAPIAHFSG